ncbi:MAG: hypothetical protein C7B46_16540 [Sulfobacillus benefaciens]|uniref:SSD domain-containing protein n=1 Tax=Sulfobacillus benefaciens TaxID=453960 RepID=A0A2T2XAX0_9FIRM|nr:MAG: hypothetical protein C7B46_16540 [Sulfobacillus benefaciens]
MPNAIIFAAWLGGMVIPAWYVLPRRWRWVLWTLVIILGSAWLKSSGWVITLPSLDQKIFNEFLVYAALGWIISAIVVRRTRWGSITASRSLLVFWLFLLATGFTSIRPLISASHSVRSLNQHLLKIYSILSHTLWQRILLVTHQATFGSIWLHLLELVLIAALLSLPALFPKIALPDGTVRVTLALVLPLVWNGFYHVEPSVVSWVLRLVIWGPFIILSFYFLLRISTRYPWLRPAVLVIILVWAWRPALSAGHHALNPAFPPSVSGVLWANRQVAHLQGVKSTAPADWLVNVSASQTHLTSAIAVNPHTSLLPGTIKRPPSSWHPTRLTTPLAQRTLNHMVASSLASTSIWALVAAVVVLFLALGVLPATGLAVGLGAVVSLFTLAILRGLETLWPISPYALNIANLLAVGLSIDYAIFQIHAFQQAWKTNDSLSRSIRIQKSSEAAISHAQTAVPWSAGALAIALIAFPLALPGGLGWSFALASMTATAMAVFCSQFLVIPLLSAYPEFWFRIKLPIALSDILDRVYGYIGRGSVVLPGLLFLLTFVLLLGIDRTPPTLTLSTPTTVAQLLPSTNTIRQAFARQSSSIPSSTAVLVVNPPSDVSWLTVQQDLKTLPTSSDVSWQDPLNAFTASQLMAFSKRPGSLPKAMQSVWNPTQRLVLVSAHSHGPVPRALLDRALRHYLPHSWHWSFTGSAHTIQATANAWFRLALGILLGAGLLASALVRWIKTGLLRAGLLALLFELAPLITTVVSYPFLSHVLPHLLPASLPFPILLLSTSLMLALALDYQVLFTHAVGRNPTADRIAQAVAQTGGSITSAGVVMATSFYVLLLAPLPFLRAAGFLIGTNVLLDTLVIRTLLMPTTYAAFLESDPARRPWRQRFDHWLALLALGWALLAIPTLIGRDRHDLHIVPAPLPIQMISTRHHPMQFW